MPGSSEHPEPELYLNTNSKYRSAETTHQGGTLGGMQMGHYLAVPDTFTSVDKKGNGCVPQLSLASGGSTAQPQTRGVLLGRDVL